MAMARRFLLRALIPAAALALTGAISLSPASASSATWQLVSVVGDPTSQVLLSSVAASSADNAWVAGLTNCDASCSTQTAIVQQWNGQRWQTVTLPDSNVGGSDTGVVVATSSASNTWIFGSGAFPSNTGYGVHVTDSGVTETALPAVGGISFNGAAVFAPNDAWAFGVTGDFFNAIFSAYAAHYDGQTWTQMPTPPVVPDSVSALSGDNLWILGQTSFTTAGFAMAHWTGSDWQTVPIPDASGLKLPAGTFFNPLSILADSPTNVWVTAGVDGPCPPCGFGSGVLLLHWNGNGWHSVDVPASISTFDTALASDGQGGLWVSGFPVNSATEDLFHFLNDHWSEQPEPTQDGLQSQIGSLAWVPGSTSLWGAATLFNFMPDGTETSQGAIDQYTP
jgi:hypothetical protein